MVQVQAHSENISSGQGSVPAKILVRVRFSVCVQFDTLLSTVYSADDTMCMYANEAAAGKKERKKKRKTKEKKKDEPIRKSSTISLYKDQCIREMIKAIEAGHAEGE